MTEQGSARLSASAPRGPLRVSRSRGPGGEAGEFSPSAGTVALRRRASSPCLKVGTQAPQTPWRIVTNRAFECLLRSFWAGEWITSGDPNAQCNSAYRGLVVDEASNEKSKLLMHCSAHC
jgi:hypothetical protein